MKKIILLVVFLSIYSFPQTKVQPDVLGLQNSLKQVITDKEYHEVNFSSVPAVTKKNTGLAIIYSFLLPGMGNFTLVLIQAANTLLLQKVLYGVHT